MWSFVANWNSKVEIRDFKKRKKNMKHEVEMSNLSSLSYSLVIEFKQTSKALPIYYKKYISNALKKFYMLHCNPIQTPFNIIVKLVKNDNKKPVDPTLFKQRVGYLTYLCNTRQDIAFILAWPNLFPLFWWWKTIYVNGIKILMEGLMMIFSSTNFMQSWLKSSSTLHWKYMFLILGSRINLWY